MKSYFAWICASVFIASGCSPEPASKAKPQESFRHVISEFKDRAGKKISERLSITVTEELAADKYPNNAATGTIHVQKQTPGGVPGNAKQTAEVIDVYFSYEADGWRCSRAVSKDFEGDKVVGEHSLGGPDIDLSNLFKWIGL